MMHVSDGLVLSLLFSSLFWHAGIVFTIGESSFTTMHYSKKMKVHSKVAAGQYVAKCAVYFCGIKTNVHTHLSRNTSPY